MKESLTLLVTCIAIQHAAPAAAVELSSRFISIESQLQTLPAGTARRRAMLDLAELRRKAASPDNQSRLSQSVLKVLALCLEMRAANATATGSRHHNTRGAQLAAMPATRQYPAERKQQPRSRNSTQPAVAAVAVAAAAPQINVAAGQQTHTEVDRQAAEVKKAAKLLSGLTLVNLPAVPDTLPAGRFAAGLTGFEKLLVSTAAAYSKATGILASYRKSLLKSPIALRAYAAEMDAKASHADAAFIKEGFADFAAQSRAMAHRHEAAARAVVAAQAGLDSVSKLLTVSRETVSGLKKLVAVTPASDRGSVRRLIAHFNLFLQKLQRKTAAANNAVKSLGFDGQSGVLSEKPAV